MVPVGQGALVRVGGQIGPQPSLLLGSPGAPHHAAVAVEHDHVPGPGVVAVPALARGPGRGAEVAEVPGGTGGPVLVVAGRRPGAGLELAPGRPVAGRELAGASPPVDVVPQRGDRSAGRRHQSGGGRVAHRGAVGDVTGGHQDGSGRLRRRDGHQPGPDHRQDGDQARGATTGKWDEPQQFPHTGPIVTSSPSDGRSGDGHRSHGRRQRAHRRHRRRPAGGGRRDPAGLDPPGLRDRGPDRHRRRRPRDPRRRVRDGGRAHLPPPPARPGRPGAHHLRRRRRRPPPPRHRALPPARDRGDAGDGVRETGPPHAGVPLGPPPGPRRPAGGRDRRDAAGRDPDGAAHRRRRRRADPRPRGGAGPGPAAGGRGAGRRDVDLDGVAGGGREEDRPVDHRRRRGGRAAPAPGWRRAPGGRDRRRRGHPRAGRRLLRHLRHAPVLQAAPRRGRASTARPGSSSPATRTRWPGASGRWPTSAPPSSWRHRSAAGPSARRRCGCWAPWPGSRHRPRRLR